MEQKRVKCANFILKVLFFEIFNRVLAFCNIDVALTVNKLPHCLKKIAKNISFIYFFILISSKF